MKYPQEIRIDEAEEADYISDYDHEDNEKEEVFVCEDCKRDFSDEVDDRSSFDEIGRVVCMPCYYKKVHEDEDNEEQYQVRCPECDTRLCINTSIMCWNNGEEGDEYDEETLCRECYYDCEYYKDDKNPDNEDEIKEYIDYLKEKEECK